MEDSGMNSVSSFPNKYEIAIIAAKEARRINDVLRHSGEDMKEKVTLVAIERVAKGKVKFVYDEEEGRRE
jgi:DNA-directed RNA polymerase omega subunit